MAEKTLARYALEPDGAIHHWLACGPVTSPLSDLARVIRANGSPFGPGQRWVINYVPASLELKARVYRQLPRLEWRPGLRPALHQPGPSSHTSSLGTPRPAPSGRKPKRRSRGGLAWPAGQASAGKNWQYIVAQEDHVIDLSLFAYTPTWMEGWLFACLVTTESLTVSAELLTVGPARLWLNGGLQVHHTGFGYVEPTVVPLSITLSPGWNDVWLHGEMIGWREARMALGLRLLDQPAVTVGLPLGDIPAEAWQRAETALSRLHLKQSAFPALPVPIWLDPVAPEQVEFVAEASIPFPEENITLPVDTARFSPLTQSARLTVQPGGFADLPVTSDLTRALSHLPGEFYLRLQLSPADDTPFVVRRNLWVGEQSFCRQPYGDYETRRRQALDHMAHMPYQVMGAIAAVETGQTGIIEPEAVALACQFLENRCDCADFYALSLLILLNRYGDHPALRPKDQQRIEDAFRGFKFWIDEPGLDAMCTYTENHQVLFHVTAYLAGQRWPDRVFANSGQTGRQQKERARRRIAEWILRRLRGGFSEWDSSSYLTMDAFAMLALVEFADSPRLREMATTLLHKIFFTLACSSWRGVHGCAQARAYVSSLKTARVENTSGLERIAWGLGAFNGETRATGLLAMARRYRVPEIIQRIGADLPELLVTRARSEGQYRPRFDLKRGKWEVNTLTRHTPDGMLSAAVDYRPGAAGWQEHLWQATLSPEVVVFTSHPGNCQEDEIARPNFWAGSARLPRVALVDNTVICLYNLSLNGGLGFTHAYFPAAACDEHVISGGWVFGRVGNGYVALGSDGDLQLTTRGRHAGQELRSRGPGQVWLCRVGRAAEDGDFSTFCRQISQHTPQIEGLNVRWMTPDGHRLAFDWEGPFLVDGRPHLLSHFPHYDNVYTQTPMGADQMAIRHGDQQLVLDLARGRVLS
jgi:hypothetical protein